ncbi:MAG: nicotinate mononucleotide-dependent phosphoribosyltransferase CobT [Cyanobacteria bacterium P01_F01_bin.86]
MIQLCAGDPDLAYAWLNRYRGRKPTFACILSFTETGLIPSISAAGTTPQARRYTALADGEFLVNGCHHTYHQTKYPLPTLSAGVSPAIITRAILNQQTIPLHLLSTGLPDRLTVPHISLPSVTAKALDTGQAMAKTEVTALFNSGRHWGHQLSIAGHYLIVGECVVGGTTTAQAVLTALGYPVAGRMSSSHFRNNHPQKQALVNQGLDAWEMGHDTSALSALAAVGDPMQATAAGMTLAASNRGGVLLAGGSQMLAVYALAKALAQEQLVTWNPQNVIVGTTRWVIEDPNADTIAIAQLIDAPYLASQINFSASPYFQLRAYERGYVKEGTGAGGCAIAAHLYQGWTRSQLRHTVEAQLRQSL